MKYFLTACIIFSLASCVVKNIRLPVQQSPRPVLGGRSFFNRAAGLGWKQRDSIAVIEILGGSIPSFFRKFTRIQTEMKDSLGKKHKAVFYVSPDYVSIGSNEDFARVPLTAMAAQQIADSFSCFLPTKKMVDIIYNSAIVKLEPVPMFAYRDSSITMWHHHLIIEGLRQGRKGLIAGIKKDVVSSLVLLKEPRQDRVAIYGWHLLNGKPIQPLYSRHVNWYTDYSHGTRLVYRTIKVDGRPMDYREVLMHPLYHKLLTNEGIGCFKYAY